MFNWTCVRGYCRYCDDTRRMFKLHLLWCLFSIIFKSSDGTQDSHIITVIILYCHIPFLSHENLYISLWLELRIIIITNNINGKRWLISRVVTWLSYITQQSSLGYRVLKLRRNQICWETNFINLPAWHKQKNPPNATLHSISSIPRTHACMHAHTRRTHTHCFTTQRGWKMQLNT